MKSKLRKSLAFQQKPPAYFPEGRPAVRIPKRWVKFVIAWFLLLPAGILTQTLVQIFTRTTIYGNFWATEEFWFFSLGVVLWLIIFIGLPRPLWLYVFGHELTHAIWVWLMGGDVFKFKVQKTGGYILADKINTGIALAPYFFPLYSFFVILLYGVVGIFLDVSYLRQFVFVLLGGTWAFHLTFTCWAIAKGQQDLAYGGIFFSLVVIYLVNLILLMGMFIMASQEESLWNVGQEILENTATFFQFISVVLKKV